MTDPEKQPKRQSPRPALAFQVGPLKLTGAGARAVAGAVLGAVLFLVIRARPALSNWPVWTSGALWLVFIVYWNLAAANTAATTSRESVESRRVHQRLLNLGFLFLFVPIPGLRTQVLPHSLGVVVAGLVAQALFFGLAVWARRHLGAYWSAAVATKAEHRLIRSGPYRTVRHPIYTAMLGMFVAAAVVSGTTHAIIAAAIIVAAYARKIPLEEQHLRGIFGSAYDDYRAHSGAVIPWIL